MYFFIFLITWRDLDGWVDGATVGGHTINNLRYADEITVITSNEDVSTVPTH